MFSIVQAQINNKALSTNLIGQRGVEFIPSLIRGIIASILVVGGLIFVFMILWGGIKYITSEGDKAQAETARKTITNSLIGLVISFALYAIVTLVGCFFGLDFLRLYVGELNISFGECRQVYGEPRDPGNPGPR